MKLRLIDPKTGHVLGGDVDQDNAVLLMCQPAPGCKVWWHLAPGETTSVFDPYKGTQDDKRGVRYTVERVQEITPSEGLSL